MLKKYFEIILLLAVLLGAMVLSQHMDAQAGKRHDAQADGAQDKRDAAARRACPAGYESVWIDSHTNQCLRLL